MILRENFNFFLNWWVAILHFHPSSYLSFVFITGTASKSAKKTHVLFSFFTRYISQHPQLSAIVLSIVHPEGSHFAIASFNLKRLAFLFFYPPPISISLPSSLFSSLLSLPLFIHLTLVPTHYSAPVICFFSPSFHDFPSFSSSLLIATSLQRPGSRGTH